MTNVITCVSGPGLIKAKEQIEGKPLGEMRLDLLNISIEEVRILWKMADNWVLTLREKFTKKETWKEEFENCLALNPVLVDVDSELPNTVKLEAINMVKKSNHELMLSYHNFQETPSFESLNLTVKS